MGKQFANGLPGVGKSNATETVIETVLKSQTITVPTLSGLGEGYVTHRVDITLDNAQKITLRGIQLGLEEKDAKLRSGKQVKTMADAVKWMIEQLSVESRT